MQDPGRYERHKTVAARDAEIYVPKLISFMTWSNREDILDVGCGAGSTGTKLILPTVESHDSKMYAVDISQKMLDYAVANHSHPRIEYALGDILSEEFPFREISFDKVFAVYVLHQIKNTRKALECIHRLLKPGGFGGFTVLTKTLYFDIFRLLAESPKWAQYMIGFEKFIPNWVLQNEEAKLGFETCLNEIGYNIVTISSVADRYVYNNIHDCIELVMALNPFIQVIPIERHNEYKGDIETLIKKLHPNYKDGGFFECEYEMVYFVVQKTL